MCGQSRSGRLRGRLRAHQGGALKTCSTAPHHTTHHQTTIHAAPHVLVPLYVQEIHATVCLARSRMGSIDILTVCPLAPPNTSTTNTHTHTHTHTHTRARARALYLQGTLCKHNVCPCMLVHVGHSSMTVGHVCVRVCACVCVCTCVCVQ